MGSEGACNFMLLACGSAVTVVMKKASYHHHEPCIAASCADQSSCFIKNLHASMYAYPTCMFRVAHLVEWWSHCLLGALCMHQSAYGILNIMDLNGVLLSMLYTAELRKQRILRYVV